MDNTETRLPRESASPRHELRLPRFVSHEDVGLGDVIKRASSAAGIRPCGGCVHRAAQLNRWLGFRSQRTGS